MTNKLLEHHSDKLEHILFHNEDKGIQYRLTVSEFLDKHYLSIREWVQDFEGDWVPTKNGLTFPYTLNTTYGLFRGLANILSDAEVLDQIIELEKNDTEQH